MTKQVYQLFGSLLLLLFAVHPSFSQDAYLLHGNTKQLQERGELMLKKQSYDSAAAYFEHLAMVHKDKKELEDFAMASSSWLESLLKAKKTAEFQTILARVKVGLSKATNQSMLESLLYPGVITGFESTQAMDSAIFYALKTQSLREEYAEKEPTKLASAYFRTAGLYTKKGEYPNAIACYEKSLAYKIKAEGEESAGVAEVLNGLGLAYFRKGDSDKAVESLEKALALRRKLFGDKHLDVAESYQSRGIAYYAKGDYPNAIDQIEKAVAIREELLGTEAPILATGYSNLGIMYKLMGSLNKGVVYYEKALQLSLKSFGEIHPNVAAIQNNIAVLHFQRGDFERAAIYYRKALDIWDKVYKGRHPDIATCYSNIGAVYLQEGDPEMALSYYYKAIQLLMEMVGESNPQVADTYVNIGNAYFDMGSYAKAESYFEKSLTIGSKVYGESHAHIANCYHGLAMSQQARKNHDLAIELYLKSVKLLKAKLGENHVELYDSYNNLGIIYKDLQKYEQSIFYYEKALKCLESANTQGNALTAVVFNNIGNVYAVQGKLEDASSYYEKSLRIWKETYGDVHPNVALGLNTLADFYSTTGNTSKAFRFYQQSFIANGAQLIDSLDHTELPKLGDCISYEQLLNVVADKAYCFGLQKKFKNAFEHYDYYTKSVAEARKALTNEEEKISLGANAVSVYGKSVELCYQSKKKENFEKAFSYSESGKGAVLMEAMAGQHAKKFAGLPNEVTELDRSLRHRKTYLEHKIEQESSANKKTYWKSELFAVNASLDSLSKAIEQKYTSFSQLQAVERTMGLKEVQAKLDDKTALVEYMFSDSALFVFTVTKKTFEFERVANRDSIEMYVTGLRNALVFRLKKTFLAKAERLHQMLLPSKLPKNIEHLVLVPDGILHQVPYEVLLTSRPSPETSYENYPYLIRKYSVSYASSALLFFENEAKASKKGGDLLGFAPIFDEGNNQVVDELSKDKLQRTDASANSSMVSRGMLINGLFVSPLPGTATEVNQIKELFESSGRKATIYLADKAREDVLKQENSKSFSYLHIATHGFVNQEKPGLSGVLLAQDSTKGEDCVLYAGEIYNLQLDAELVVLSACETGLGQLSHGEGVIGLARALTYAGAKNLLLSLWKVSDESTADLMTKFYKFHLDGMGISESLRNAKLALLKEGKFAAPYFWSPFVILGR